MSKLILGLNKLIIGAPFGNYLKFDGTSSTEGTFTLENRGGLCYRLWRMALTLRYRRGLQGWTNRLGLPNPGIRSWVPLTSKRSIVSICGLHDYDWEPLTRYASPFSDYVEYNISCPNVAHISINLERSIDLCINHFESVPIIKVPPIRWLQQVDLYYKLGVRHFHLCNTMPTPAGGLSGKTLMQYSLQAVRDVRQKYPDVAIIGGGGITHEQDIFEYNAAGANFVSIASMLLNPFNWRKVKRLAQAANCLR